MTASRVGYISFFMMLGFSSYALTGAWLIGSPTDYPEVQSVSGRKYGLFGKTNENTTLDSGWINRPVDCVVLITLGRECNDFCAHRPPNGNIFHDRFSGKPMALSLFRPIRPRSTDFILDGGVECFHRTSIVWSWIGEQRILFHGCPS